jgi:putative restriction endonuclease
MTAFWLTYKPRTSSAPKGWPAKEMDALVEGFKTNPASATTLWRIASHRAATVGDRVYLFKQGQGPRGIFGIGEIIEEPRLQPDPTDTEGGAAERAKIKFLSLVNPRTDFLLNYESIEELVPRTLIDAHKSGNSVPPSVEAQLKLRLAAMTSPFPRLLASEADDTGFDPDSFEDQRDRAMRAIRIRRGQPRFREELMNAYEGRCAITGCAIADVLEAAHITPYAGSQDNHVSNGLLLRADLHTLFDCGLIAIDPATRRVG